MVRDKGGLVWLDDGMERSQSETRFGGTVERTY